MFPGQRPVLAGVGRDLGAAIAMLPNFKYFISRASISTWTNSASICGRNRRRNVAMLSWSGWVSVHRTRYFGPTAPAAGQSVSPIRFSRISKMRSDAPPGAIRSPTSYSSPSLIVAT